MRTRNSTLRLHCSQRTNGNDFTCCLCVLCIATSLSILCSITYDRFNQWEKQRKSTQRVWLFAIVSYHQPEPAVLCESGNLYYLLFHRQLILTGYKQIRPYVQRRCTNTVQQSYRRNVLLHSETGIGIKNDEVKALFIRYFVYLLSLSLSLFSSSLSFAHSQFPYHLVYFFAIFDRCPLLWRSPWNIMFLLVTV